MNESANKYYDLLASVYDKATEAPGAWNPPSMVYETIKHKISSQSRILDIGIGTGQSIAKIYGEGQYKEIWGVDVSTKMLDICKEKYPKAKLTRISSVADIENINGCFDMVISSGVTEFIEDIDLLFKHVSCKQEKGGIFAFTYEPIIYFHPFQNDRKSLTVPNKSSSFYLNDFYTYRRNPVEISHLLDTNNFRVTEDFEFIAYKKGTEQIIYHVVVAIRV